MLDCKLAPNPVDPCAFVGYRVHMAKERTDVRLDREELVEAREQAAREGLTLSDILRRWIRLGREQEKRNSET